MHLQIEACLRSAPDSGVSPTSAARLPETGGGRGGGSGMFNSAPSLKECSSISNAMLLIAASEGFREPLLASSSQVSGLIFHYSERGVGASPCCDGAKQSEAAGPSETFNAAGNLMASLLLVGISPDLEAALMVVLPSVQGGCSRSPLCIV